MAAPKGKGGGGSGKKAKLAHEKRSDEKLDFAQFRLRKVMELVTDKDGKAGAVVELDEKGTMGIVNTIYVLKGEDGALAPRNIACPALYDAVALKQAIERYQAYQA